MLKDHLHIECNRMMSNYGVVALLCSLAAIPGAGLPVVRIDVRSESCHVSKL